MNTISFMTANYVAKQLDFDMTRGWGQGEKAANAYFQPIQTYRDRMGEMVALIKSIGFDAVDLWLAHLNPNWATAEHIRIARELLEQYGLRVVSFGGWLGSTPEEFEATCRLAAALQVKILGGSTSTLEKDRAFVIRTCKQYGVRLGLENHPEKTASELAAKLGAANGGSVGVCVDTGWFGTQGYDAAQALFELRRHLVHVHLKDVLAAGTHDSCRLGQGVVPVERCVQVLKQVGYTGGISVEHEPEHFDPTEDCRVGLQLVKQWLS